jgi:hypothetical protein
VCVGFGDRILRSGFRLWVEDGLRLRVFMFFVFELVRVVGVFRVFRVVGC